jgi:Rrf2 family nitric oxide-sensitive transcriptional repressor
MGNIQAPLGYLDTTRGRQGGFRLAVPPDCVRLGDVVPRTEGTMTLVDCVDRRTAACPLARAGGLTGARMQACDAFLAVLDRHALATLRAEPQWVAHVRTLRPERPPTRQEGLR